MPRLSLLPQMPNSRICFFVRLAMQWIACIDSMFVFINATARYSGNLVFPPKLFWPQLFQKPNFCRFFFDIPAFIKQRIFLSLPISRVSDSYLVRYRLKNWCRSVLFCLSVKLVLKSKTVDNSQAFVDKSTVYFTKLSVSSSPTNPLNLDMISSFGTIKSFCYSWSSCSWALISS